MFKLLKFCVFFIIFIDKFIEGKLLYFPSTNVEMTLIGQQNKSLASNETTIFIARTYTEPTQSSLLDDIQYRYINIPKQFIFNNNTGEMKIREDFFYQAKDQELYEIEIFAIDLNNYERNATFHMKILVKLLRNEDFNCEKYVNHLCFWPSIKYQVLENQQPSFLGLLSSQYYKNKCKNYHLHYTISKGKMKIKLEQQQFSKTWYLLTNVSLDRDIANSKHPANFPATINCYVNNSAKNYEHSTAKTIHVEVLDEDDNPLISQVTPVMKACLSNSKVRKNEKLNLPSELLFDDGDTYDVNNYETKILQDYENILNVSCKKFENHVQKKTGYFCEMYFRKDFTFKKLPYVTQLKITDTNLGQMYGNRSIVVTIEIKLCDMKNQRPSELFEHTTKATHGEMYPFIETKILRTAAPFARVAQPSHTIQNINLYKFRIKNDSSWVLSKSKTPAFNITSRHGIVYVQNNNILKKPSLSNVDLIIEWSFKNDSKNHAARGTDLLRITIVDELNISCADLDNDVSKWVMCAQFDTIKKCHDACGVATGGYNTLRHIDKIAHRGTRCTWRGNGTQSKGYQTEDYQTCTPDITTCPDSICDDLEQLHYGICPQDCTKEVMFGDLNTNKQGIQLGIGVCTCDETTKCVCVNPVATNGKHKKVKDVGLQTDLNDEARKEFLDLNIHKAQSTHKCGPLCLAGIGLGVTLITIVVGILVCRLRAWRNMGIREHKYISSVTALSHGYSSNGGDYVHQTTSTTNNTSLTPGSMPGNGLEFNFTMNVSISKKYTPDPKWEFPRQNLQIEQILGEGEFGRVLKARAKEIAGGIGYTTVAVKTLKENAQGSELDDLISEYELLKEVSHPNVIRLLGVSMLPGGPAYLIIEYAEFGSLRNYLRKSRHLEVENINLKCHEYNLVPSQPSAEEEVFTVTAKDILSFAWQISKGMAYLGDKKLVHRDLAARNVLVATGKICKISDFGLTRDVYEDNAYLKRSKGRVPIKWMAPESLADHVYTNRSDVWSFGILLWELVTLGGSPYPGVAVENLFTLLRSGYRMEKPPNCSLQLYTVMQKCWEIDPVERPSFRSLTEKFETMLEDGVEYLNLNLHTVQNKAYFSTLSDTSNPTSGESKQLNIPKYGNDCISPKSKDPFIVNLNEAKSILPKCGEVEKLPIWAVSQTTSPTLKNANDYQNENNQIGMSHYEIPKNPNNNNNNRLPLTNLVSTNDNKIHLSYIDMNATVTNQNVEEKPLLRTQSYDNLPSQQKITQV